MNAEKLRNARCSKLTYWLWQECGKHSMKTIWKLSKKLSFHDRTSAAADSLLLFPTPDGQSEFFLYKRICRQQRCAVAEERKTENFSDFKYISTHYLYSSIVSFLARKIEIFFKNLHDGVLYLSFRFWLKSNDYFRVK